LKKFPSGHVTTASPGHEWVKGNHAHRTRLERRPEWPRIPAGGGPTSQGSEPATHITSSDTAASGTSRGQRQRDARRVNVHTLKAKPPLTRGNTCPRWDSKRTPALANTGNSRKHAESGPIRPRYGPVQGPKCGHCPHPQFSGSKASR